MHIRHVLSFFVVNSTGAAYELRDGRIHLLTNNVSSCFFNSSLCIVDNRYGALAGGVAFGKVSIVYEKFGLSGGSPGGTGANTSE